MDDTEEIELMNPPACPGCHARERVRRKLLAISPDINSWALPPLPGQKHLVVNPPEGRGVFLDAFHCDACQRGFVTSSILAEVGLTVADILDLEIGFTDTNGPEPSSGYYGPRLGRQPE